MRPCSGRGGDLGAIHDRRSPIQRAAARARLLADRAESSELLTARWTQPQLDFLAVCTAVALLRAGNQWLGKSYIGAADTILRCIGEHPFDPRGRILPCIARVISPTTQHSIQIQEKFWALVPKHLVKPGQEFDPAVGMRGRNPMIQFLNGSRIEFRSWGNTPGGDRAALANSGGTLDHVLIDELCPKRLFNELVKRVLRRNGTIRIVVTPINAPTLAAWLREEVAAGKIRELHYRMEARWCIPVGAAEPLCDSRTGKPMDEAWIRAQIAATDPDEVDVVCHGGWQVTHHDRSFAAWNDDLVIRNPASGTLRLPRLRLLGLGLDYGEQPGRFVITLAGVDEAGCVWVLGEWCGRGTESPSDIARGIRALLRGWGYELKHVGRIVGDVNSAGVLGGGRSMNEVVAEALGISAETILSAWKPRGSVDNRFQLINFAMARRGLRIHESCVRLLESVRTHRKGSQNAAQLKDPIDALWYVADEWLQASLPAPARLVVR